MAGEEVEEEEEEEICILYNRIKGKLKNKVMAS